MDEIQKKQVSQPTGIPNPSLSYDLISKCKNIIKGDLFRFDPKPYYVGSEESLETIEPEIMMIKEKDTVTGIQIKCVCGRIINIECN